MSNTYPAQQIDKTHRWKEDALVRAPDVADYLAVSVRTVQRLTLEEGCPHYRFGRAVRYRPSEVEAWTLTRSAEPHGLAGTLAEVRAQRELGDRVADHVSANLHELVAEARAEGYSWQQIGDALGVSRQAVMKRFKSA